MKKILVSGLMLSSLLFGNCTKAEKIFSDSRDETDVKQKIALIIKAKKMCPSLAQIEIEMERLKINLLLGDNQFKGLEIRLNNLMGDTDSKDGLPYEFRFNTKRQINRMFKTLYSKQKSMAGKKSIFGVTVNKLDEKLADFDKKLKVNDLKSLGDVGGMYHSDLKFMKNSYAIDDLAEAKALKAKIKEIIDLHSDAIFSVTGYASSEGSSKYNKKLAEKRAKGFVAFVGKNHKNIKTFSKGEAFLICNDGLIPEHDENNDYRCINGENKEASRRVTVRRVR